MASTIAVNKTTMWIVVAAVGAVGVYFLYRWYQGQQSGAASGTGGSGVGIGGTGLGTNLNSSVPDFGGGSSGPDSGGVTNYNPPGANITIEEGPTTSNPPPPEKTPAKKPAPPKAVAPKVQNTNPKDPANQAKHPVKATVKKAAVKKK